MIETKPNAKATKQETNRSSVTKTAESVLSEYLHLEETNDKSKATNFVKRLKSIVKHIHGLQSIKFMYKMNDNAEKDIGSDLKELDCLVEEMKAVLSNIDRLRHNKLDVEKELNHIKGSLKIKTKEELQEIETLIAIYDKDLLKKWHLAKKSVYPHTLENFVNNLAGKKQAIEHVYKMALDKLATLKKNTVETQNSFQLTFRSSPTLRTQIYDTDTDSDGQYSFC